MSNLSSKKNKLTAGWLIVIACMFIQAIPAGVIANTQALFIHPVITERGFSLAAFSLMFGIGTIVSAVAGPFIGKLYSKINIKLLYIVGAIIAGGGFLSFSLATELWHFYVLAGVVQIGSAVISGIGTPLLISAWFDEATKGKALGIAFAGGSIGNFFLQPLASKIIASQGYASAYLILGILSLAVGLPIALFLVRMPKNSSEIVKAKNDKTETNTKETSLTGYTLKEAAKTKYFWMMCFGFTFVGLYVSAYSVQYAAYFQGELKFDAATVGITGSIFAICSLLGNVLGGSLFDKLGALKCLIASSILVLTSGVFLLLSKNNVMFAHAFSAIKGLAVYAYMIGPAYLTGSFFGNKEYGSILGIVQLLFAVGISSGSALFGVLVGKLGYDMSWTLMLGAVAIAYVLLIGATIGMTKLNKQKNENISVKAA